jgi:hypothetical protein
MLLAHVNVLVCDVSGFHKGAAEDVSLLEYYAMSNGK